MIKDKIHNDDYGFVLIPQIFFHNRINLKVLMLELVRWLYCILSVWISLLSVTVTCLESDAVMTNSTSSLEHASEKLTEPVHDSRMTSVQFNDEDKLSWTHFELQAAESSVCSTFFFFFNLPVNFYWKCRTGGTLMQSQIPYIRLLFPSLFISLFFYKSIDVTFLKNEFHRRQNIISNQCKRAKIIIKKKWCHK